MLLLKKDGWTSKEEMEKWHDFLLILLRDMAFIKITRDATGLINSDLADYITTLSKSMNIKVIIKIYKKIHILRRYLYFNLNRSLTWNYTGSLLRAVMDGTYA